MASISSKLNETDFPRCPPGCWVGVLFVYENDVMKASGQHSDNDNMVDEHVYFKVEKAPNFYASMVGKIARLRWQDDVQEVSNYVKAVTKRNSMGLLTSLACAQRHRLATKERKEGGVCENRVKLKYSTRVCVENGIFNLLIDEEPIMVSAPCRKKLQDVRGEENIKSTWSEKYEELAQFKKGYGHCNVPPDYSPNPRLATWAAQQRNQYRYFLDGKPSSITVERKEMLDQLDFGWSYKPERRKRKKQCTTYSNKEGNDMVSKPTSVLSSTIQRRIMYEIPTFPPPTCMPSDTNPTSFTYIVPVNQSFRFFQQDSLVLESPTREEASRTRKKRTEVMIARGLGFYQKRVESMTKPAILKAVKTVYSSEEDEGTNKKDQLIDVQTSIISTNPLKVPKVNISHPVSDDQSISSLLSLESSSPTISSKETETKAVKSTKSSKSNSTKNKKPKINKGKAGSKKKWSMHNDELPDGNDADSKRQRRLIRNRLSAQMHRNRSRDYLESLKQEIKDRDDRISHLEEEAQAHQRQIDSMRAKFDILRRHFGDSMIDRLLKSQSADCLPDIVHDKETDGAS